MWVVLGSAFAPECAAQEGCLILRGRSGRGKTHLAMAIAYQAILYGHEALFATANDLVDGLSLAARHGRLREALADYVRPSYSSSMKWAISPTAPMPPTCSSISSTIADCHKLARTMVFTTKKPLEQCGRVLHDPCLAKAILDRILKRGRIVTLEGLSMPTRHLDRVPVIPRKESNS